MNHSADLPNAGEWLTYLPKHMNADLPTGLWICLDVLDVDFVKTNAACLSGTWEDIKHCREFFECFGKIFVAIAQPDMCALTAEKISEHVISTSVLRASDTAFKGCSSIREYCKKYGNDKLGDITHGFIEIENPRLLNYAKIKRPKRNPTILSGIAGIDKGIGGFRKSELCVWTGKRGDGKTTLVNNILLDSVEHGHKVCIYSGELPPDRLRDWHYLQAAGHENVRSKTYEESGKTYWDIPQETESKIDEWWNGKMFCFDTRHAKVHEENTIFGLFEYAWYRHSTSVYVLDNLMTAQINDSREYYRAQSRFVTRLTEFARRREVLIHLIAHPRKTGKSEIQADDVSGIGDITNIADNVFRVDRLPEGNDSGADARVKILKNREYGKRGDVLLLFDESCRRFSDMDGSGFLKQYSWGDDGFRELPGDLELPWLLED